VLAALYHAPGESRPDIASAYGQRQVTAYIIPAGVGCFDGLTKQGVRN